MKRVKIVFSLIFFLLCLPLSAQNKEEDKQEPLAPDAPAMPIYVQVGKAAYKGDSIPEIVLPTVYKYPPLLFKSAKKQAEYNRLVANVKRLLPVARMARYVLIETYEYLETVPDKKAREAHINLVEEDLKRKFTPMIKKMSRQQGSLLLKLIDRECNQTGYSIAKAFIGSFRANMYQGIGLLFGNSLNKKYDPEGDDRLTERVVRMVESGQL